MAEHASRSAALAQLQHLPTLPSWVTLDPTAADAIVARTTQTIHALTLPLSDTMVAVMRAQLRNGIVVGANPRQTARRIMTQLEGAFMGGAVRAERIARTEQLDAHRVAQHAAEQSNRGILKGWVWYTTFDTRTCVSCLVKHGTEYPVDEYGPTITRTAAAPAYRSPRPPPSSDSPASWSRPARSLTPAHGSTA